MSNDNQNIPAPTHRARPYHVTARTIGAVLGNNTGGGQLLQLNDGTTYVADTAMTARHFPTAGDYLVVGEDGYPYLNPADVFERKFEPITPDENTIDFESRFGPGDVVLFQPNIGAGVIGAVEARVVRSYLEGAAVCYDIDVLHDYGGVDFGRFPLRGVDSLMVLEFNDIEPVETFQQQEDDTLTIRYSTLKMAADILANPRTSILDVINGARALNSYLLNDVRTDAIEPASVAASRGRLDELAPNDAPRVTPSSVEDELAEEYYFTGRQAVLALGKTDHPELERLTICVLRLRSGALVVGTSIVVSLENFDESVARQRAYRDAMAKLTDHLGFQMKQALYAEDLRNLDIEQ